MFVEILKAEIGELEVRVLGLHLIHQEEDFRNSSADIITQHKQEKNVKFTTSPKCGNKEAGNRSQLEAR